MKALEIVLCAVSYRVSECDGQVIFEEQSGFHGLASQFTFQWKGCGWYLVDFEASFDRVYLPHIVAAAEWVNENYSIAWTNGTGVVSLKEQPGLEAASK